MIYHYIDPGTGSMLFAILIGIAGAANFAFRSALVKLKFFFSGGRDVQANDDVIPIAIFSDDKRYWNVFEPICREFDRRGVSVVYLTASQDDPVFECDIPSVRPSFLGEGNKVFAKLNLLKATMVLSTTPGLDVYQWKRSRDVESYVHIFHAAGDVTLYRMFGIDYYDSLLVAADYQVDDIRKLEQMRGLPQKEIAITGIPYMDEMVKRLEAADSVESDVRTVLLAPSWGPSAIFSRHGSKIIGELLETGYNIIVRPHPQSFKSEAELIEGIMAEYPESDRLEWNRDRDNFECLRKADILISDFSGVIFDFALVYDKPIIYADADVDVSLYDAWWLDKPIWEVSALPRIGMALSDDSGMTLKEKIDACIDGPGFAQSRQAVREETWQLQGQGAERTVDFLMEKYKQLTEQEGAE